MQSSGSPAFKAGPFPGYPRREALQEPPWICKPYEIWNGISFAPIDLLKGVIAGLASYSIFLLTEINIKDVADAFLKGFALSGIMGGLEDVMDGLTATALNYPQGGLQPGTYTIIHEIFQSMLLQGLIGGAVAAGMSMFGE